MVQQKGHLCVYMQNKITKLLRSDPRHGTLFDNFIQFWEAVMGQMNRCHPDFQTQSNFRSMMQKSESPRCIEAPVQTEYQSGKQHLSPSQFAICLQHSDPKHFVFPEVATSQRRSPRFCQCHAYQIDKDWQDLTLGSKISDFFTQRSKLSKIQIGQEL